MISILCPPFTKYLSYWILAGPQSKVAFHIFGIDSTEIKYLESALRGIKFHLSNFKTWRYLNTEHKMHKCPCREVELIRERLVIIGLRTSWAGLRGSQGPLGGLDDSLN